MARDRDRGNSAARAGIHAGSSTRSGAAMNARAFTGTNRAPGRPKCERLDSAAGLPVFQAAGASAPGAHEAARDRGAQAAGSADELLKLEELFAPRGALAG